MSDDSSHPATDARCSERTRVIEEFIRREGPVYVPQIAAATLISSRDVRCILSRLQGRGLVKVHSVARVAWAKKPVASYAPVGASEPGNAAVEILRCFGAR